MHETLTGLWPTPSFPAEPHKKMRKKIRRRKKGYTDTQEKREGPQYEAGAFWASDLNWMFTPNFATDFLDLSFLGVTWIYFCDILKTIKDTDMKFTLCIHVPFSCARSYMMF